MRSLVTAIGASCALTLSSFIAGGRAEDKPRAVLAADVPRSRGWTARWPDDCDRPKLADREISNDRAGAI